MPAEWETVGGVIVAWPHEDTDWAYMLDEVQQTYDDLIHAISRHAVAVVIAPDTSILRERFSDIAQDKILFFDVDTNDTWTRDYGVITTEDAAGNTILNDFGFNAWGGKFEWNLDNAVTAKMVEAGLLRGHYNDCNDFILEGGSIESDGCGTILTTDSCLLTDTRGRNMPTEQMRAFVERELLLRLGADRILWLNHGALEGDDTDGHIDTLARIAPNDTILYVASSCDGEPDSQTAELDKMLETLRSFRTRDGKPYNLLELPLPNPIYDEDGNRIPATYANYLVVNDAVLMPSYGQPQKDLLAEMTLKVAFPDHTIERVDCNSLIKQHGSLHCATMQVPQSVLPTL